MPTTEDRRNVNGERRMSRLFTVKSSLDASLEVQILANGGSRGGPDGRGRQRSSGGRGWVGQAHEETASTGMGDQIRKFVE